MTTATIEASQSRMRAIHARAVALSNGATPTYKNEVRDLGNELTALNAHLNAETGSTGDLPEPGDSPQSLFAMTRELEKPLGRVTSPQAGVINSKGTKGNGAFNSAGDFMRSVFNSARGVADPRLVQNAATTYGREGVNSDGGFAVPVDLTQSILQLINGDDSLLKLTNQLYTGSNGVEIPTDALAPHDASGTGVQALWTGEAEAITQSKPKLGMTAIKLEKLAALVPLTEELLEDGAAVASWLPQKVGSIFTAKLNTAIVRGTGIGQPLGILNSGAKIIVDAVGGQGANTVKFANIVAMWARLPNESKKRAVWLVHPDVETQLLTLSLNANSTGMPILLPGNTAINAGPTTLLGRPLISCEACSALGTEGDIILADLAGGYLTVQKQAGLRADVSIHVYFEAMLSAFRWSLRIGGQPAWSAPITRQNGSNTVSPFITLSSTRT